MSQSGPGPGPAPSGRSAAKVTAGLAHRGDNDLVIVLLVESPEHLTPIAVPITDDNAHQLRAQLAAALVEKPPPGAAVPGLLEYLAGRLHTDGRPLPSATGGEFDDLI